MNNKIMLRIVSLLMLLAVVLPASSANLDPAVSPSNSATTTENPRAQELLLRLTEIKEMSKSEMTRMEKKGLRKEVKEIKKEMKAIKGGVYLSVGAIIIIILLLILIL